LSARRALLLGLWLLAAGCGPGEPPSRPAWDQDVMPLLQGRCNGCHGETVGEVDPTTGKPRESPRSRLDFCSGDTAAFRELGITGVAGAVVFLPPLFATQLEPDPKTGRALMPPPPAAPLTDYEYRVLKKWVQIVAADIDAACLKAVRNRRPELKLIQPPREAGDTVDAVLEVVDPDRDGVLGKATLGTATVDIKGAGRRTLRFPRGAPIAGELRVTVTDGYDTTILSQKP
jgi:hypothetical protein